MRYLNVWPTVANRNDVWRDFNSLFEEFGRGLSIPTASRTEEKSFSPLVDVHETEDSYHLAFDLPGMKKEEIKVELLERVLHVSGERKREESSGRHSERFFGKFHRSIALPKDVDPESVEASFEDGVLKVSVPKTKETQARTVTIK